MKRASLILLSAVGVIAVALFMGCSDQSGMPTAGSSSAIADPLASGNAQSVNQVGPNNVYTYLIGAGALCDANPDNCPDISQAPNGDQFTLTGQGTVEISRPVITGGGTYEKRDSTGTVISSGTWTAGKLYGFVSYGPIASDSSQFGGRMQASIDLSGLSGEIILEVTCAQGTHVPNSAVTGATVKDVGEQFRTPIHGSTVFIRQ